MAKILYVVGNTNEFNGSSISFLNLVRNVNALGNEIVVFAPNNEGLIRILQNEGITTYSSPFLFDIWPDFSVVTPSLKSIIIYSLVYFRQMYRNHKAKKYLEKILDQEKPDIVHTNVSPVTVGYKAAKKKGIPHVVHIREYGDKDFNLKIRNIKKILQESYTISITKDIAQYRQVQEPGKDVVIYNGIYPSNATKYIEEKEPFFFYAGTVTEKKGLKLMIEGYIKYAYNRPNSYKLLIAGLIPSKISQVMVNQLKSALKKKDLDSKVEWLGEIPNVSDYMQRTSATIVPSLFEGFGRVMPEAYFNGSVVIGNNTAGTKEQFDNGLELTGEEIGFRFTTTDDLASTLGEITDNPEIVKPYIKRGQFVSQELYSNEAYVANILHFYKQILNKVKDKQS